MNNNNKETNLDKTYQVLINKIKYYEKEIEDLKQDNIKYENEIKQLKENKYELFNKVSHDFRTSLNTIIGYSNLSLSQALSCSNLKCESSFKAIKKGGLQILKQMEMINDIVCIDLEYSKISKKTINIEEIINTSIYPVNDDIKNKNIDININIANSINNIYTEPEKLNKILINLIDNAVKFNNDNGKLQINVKINPENEKEILFSIKDTGIGIHSKDRFRIFNAFFQLDTGIDKKYLGSGLGLFLTKKFIEQLDGKIWIESKLDEGSEFLFTLPNEIEINDKIKNDKIKTNTNNNKLKNLSNCNILIVEDDAYSIHILSQILKHHKANIFIASDGEEALKVLKKNNKINIIIMDIMMAVMDGFTTTMKIREKPEFKNTPIIALTALTNTNDIIKCYNSGCNDYLAKPFEINKLISTITKWID